MHKYESTKMISPGHILIINPGSTSTKLAIYRFNLEANNLEMIDDKLLEHSNIGEDQDLQLNQRLETVENYLNNSGITPQLIMARGAPLRPVQGGTYAVNDSMISDIQTQRYSRHASNLAALIGHHIGIKSGIPVYVTDPITTDEFDAVARVSGVPGLPRKSRSHALNIKASLRKLCSQEDKDFQDTSWVVCHLGGGISVAAVRDGRIVDVNDALLGMGPFSPERAGALPTSGLIKLIFEEGYDRESLEMLLSKQSGLNGYLGTSDLRVIEDRIQSGDGEAQLIFDAMVYQIAKEIAAMASVLLFQIEGVLLTGGMANSVLLCDSITSRVSAIAPIYIKPGENEMEALAQAGFRILNDEESVKIYKQG